MIRAINERKIARKIYFKSKITLQQNIRKKATAIARIFFFKVKRESWHLFRFSININTPPNNYPITINGNPINHDENFANTFADHFTNTLITKFEPEKNNDLLMYIQIHSETENVLSYTKDSIHHELQQRI